AYDVTVYVTDGANATGTQFSWTVTDSNALAISNPGSFQFTESDAVSLTPTVTNANGQDLVYFAQGLPAGLSIDHQTGEISGTLALTAAEQGSSSGLGGTSGDYQVTWGVTTGTHIAIQSFSVAVTDNSQISFSN